MPAYRDWLLVVGAYGAIHFSDVASAHGSDPLGWTLSSSPTESVTTTRKVPSENRKRFMARLLPTWVLRTGPALPYREGQTRAPPQTKQGWFSSPQASNRGRLRANTSLVGRRYFPAITAERVKYWRTLVARRNI